jgi:hypothetical protein
MKSLKVYFASLIAVLMLIVASGQASAQGMSGEKDNSKKEEKQLKKEAKKLEKTSEEAAQGLGRDAVFCILAAHTSIAGYETAQQLKAKFDSLTDFPFGQFVAAALLADRLDKEGFGLNEIIAKLEDGSSIGQITKEAGVNMGEVRKGFGQMRSELARSINNPPTRNCFETTP